MASLRNTLLGLFLLPWLAGCVVLVGSPFEALKSKPGLQETVVDGEGDAKLLIIDITGFISDQPTSRALGLVQERSMLDRVTEELDKAAEDEDIAALLLRIDSPGGGVTASDEIYHRIRRYSEETEVPVVAALGGIAASGGYYIACAADEIVGHPTTVTGSVGVIIIGINVAGLMDKLGVENQTFTTGNHKDMLSPLRQTRPEEAEIVEGVLDSMFERFKAVVKAGRPNLDPAAWPQITDGRIFSADEAERIGMIDATGRLQDAVDRAKALAGLEDASVIKYHRAGATVNTVYSQFNAEPGSHTELPGLPIQASSPQFLYFWQPGL